MEEPPKEIKEKPMLVSIFNDVIGPVMRGPSSSHCAGAFRLGRLARDLMSQHFTDVLLEFDRNGSLPATYVEQGSEMGLCGGLLGWDIIDERLPRSLQFLQESGINIKTVVIDSGDEHPNTYRLTLTNDRGEKHSIHAISTGGGMLEVICIDGYALSMWGDYHETLIWVDDDGTKERDAIAFSMPIDAVELHNQDGRSMIVVKAQQFVSEASLESLQENGKKLRVSFLAPVLPVRSRKDMSVPFSTCEEMLAYDAGKNTPMWKLAVAYEAARSGLDEAAIIEKMAEIIRVLRTSIAAGIAGTDYDDRILGHQSGVFQERLQKGLLLPGGLLNKIVLYVTAIMEVKSSMGVVVAAPTAGACAALPAAVIATAEELGLTETDMAKAMLAAGLVGAFIATHWTFAAEVGGCQAEGGSAGSMAGAALVTLANGTLKQAVTASSLTFQSMLGLICDPVANRVEVPCLGKNVMAASNALSCANMALADFEMVIPLDQVIETAKRVAKMMPREVRCTALGGLATTPASLAIEQQLIQKKANCGAPSCAC